MAVNVETLEKLERKITLSLPQETIQAEINTRLRKMARTVRMDGFRPGKVPLSVVAQRYGSSVQYDVINDKVGEAFFEAANEAKLRVAGQPSITQKDDAGEGSLAFEATFEVLPDVVIGDLSDAEVDKAHAEVNDAAIERTLDILRKQRRTFAQRAKDAAAEDGDRVTVDFTGKIDGEEFAGGKAEDFAFVLGEGQMLPEFETAVRGMKAGESKTFPLAFPEDYHGKDVAGKTADFLVTIKKLEAAHLPEVDDKFAKSLGVKDGTVDALRADIQKNLEREIKARLLARNKQAVMNALIEKSTLDLPHATVHAEIHRLIDQARAELQARGMKDVDKVPFSDDAFREQAERRVRLGLIVAELVEKQDLKAKPEQVKAQIEEIASSYEKPAEVVRYYYADEGRLGDVEAMVVENNVTDYVMGVAKVNDKELSFEELMGNN